MSDVERLHKMIDRVRDPRVLERIRSAQSVSELAEAMSSFAARTADALDKLAYFAANSETATSDYQETWRTTTTKALAGELVAEGGNYQAFETADLHRSGRTGASDAEAAVKGVIEKEKEKGRKKSGDKKSSVSAADSAGGKKKKKSSSSNVPDSLKSILNGTHESLHDSDDSDDEGFAARAYGHEDSDY